MFSGDESFGEPSGVGKAAEAPSSADNGGTGLSDPVAVPIGSLELSGSPRIDGEDPAHVRLLVEIDSDLPPIIVHRRTMRVIDGRHRLRAAALRGDKEIGVRFFDGDESAAFILAVRANIAHGLPLSLADRRAAAGRILELHPEWSDRAIGECSGLSADTVAGVRQRSTAGSGQLNARVGRDGKTRPLDSTVGRLRASEIFNARPNASLREIAREAGIAVGTARDVRERIRRGADPVPARNGGTKNAAAAKDGRNSADPGPTPMKSAVRGTIPVELENLASTLQRLRKDPSLRFNETGRRLLRWLDQHALASDEEMWLVTAVPPHCANVVADLARAYSVVWQELAEAIEQRGRNVAM